MARKPRGRDILDEVAPWEDAPPGPPVLVPNRDLYPYDTAGMPRSGPDFGRLAMAMVDQPQPPKLVLKGLDAEEKEQARARHLKRWERYSKKFEKALRVLYAEALYDPGFTLQVQVKGRTVDATLVSGTTFRSARLAREDRDYGPIQNYDVMIVSKYPGVEETQQLLNFHGGSSEALYQALKELGLADIERTSTGEGWDKVTKVVIHKLGKIGDWYFTNIVRHQSLDPSTTALAVGWTKNCLPLLEQELRLVLPKFILCFGSEAAKAVLGK
jgi:Uracil DNA glycosylase superfamily